MVALSKTIIAILGASAAHAASITGACPSGQELIANNKCCPGVAVKGDNGGTACCVGYHGSSYLVSSDTSDCTALVDTDDPDYDSKVKSAESSSASAATATSAVASSSSGSVSPNTATATSASATSSGSAAATANSGAMNAKAGLSAAALGLVVVPVMWYGF